MDDGRGDERRAGGVLRGLVCGPAADIVTMYLCGGNMANDGSVYGEECLC